MCPLYIIICPRLSSSSWCCQICRRDVGVSRRNFCQQIDLPELSCHHLSESPQQPRQAPLGASISSNSVFLVSEFFPDASLAHCLLNRRNSSYTDLVTWTSRMQIASDVAHGLDYINNFSDSNSEVHPTVMQQPESASSDWSGRTWLYWRRNRRFHGGPPLAAGRQEEHHLLGLERRVMGDLEKLEEKRMKGRERLLMS
ncbi:uncharacterized protein LOC124820515, partial [Vigna umbellata]|uniref:uncharacterized protein LOC124820515 n=1 Tax=Vigna umbellata TaxID=87088 RepID=UPI001F5FE65E